MARLRRPSSLYPARMKHADHARLWRLVEGAVVDAFQSHPEYLAAPGHKSAVASITKRVVGQLVGFSQQTLAGGRLGDCSPVDPAQIDRVPAIVRRSAEGRFWDESCPPTIQAKEPQK